jgi:hypothetical protein
MRKCANIFPYMRSPLVIYDFATALNFLIYEKNLIVFFISETVDYLILFAKDSEGGL